MYNILITRPLTSFTTAVLCTITCHDKHSAHAFADSLRSMLHLYAKETHTVTVEEV